jgi:hypothetical protein
MVKRYEDGDPPAALVRRLPPGALEKARKNAGWSVRAWLNQLSQANNKELEFVITSPEEPVFKKWAARIILDGYRTEKLKDSIEAIKMVIEQTAGKLPQAEPEVSADVGKVVIIDGYKLPKMEDQRRLPPPDNGKEIPKTPIDLVKATEPDDEE